MGALRAVRVLLALLACLAAGNPVAAAGRTASHAVQQVAADDAPLQVSIDGFSPATLPQRGRVTVTGTVTNTSEDGWDAVVVFPLTSPDPIRTSAGLARAAASDPLVPIGDRLVREGVYAQLGSLAPGESAAYTMRVPMAELQISGRPGVYLWGVHALGQVGADRDEVADGRARTFVPLMPRRGEGTQDLALVLPLRRGQLHTADGRIRGLRAWARDLGPGGRLRGVVDLAAAAGSRPVTLLVDPAVAAAADRLARGNPPRALGPTLPADPGSQPGEEEPAASPGPSEEPEGPAPPPRVQRAADAAAVWLARLGQAMEDADVLSLPYGDLDVAAATAAGTDLYERSRGVDELLSRLGGDPAPALATPSGYLLPETLEAAEPGTTVLVSDAMLPRTAPSVVTVDGTAAVAYSEAATAGGPGPDDPLAPVAVRQRILAEAAVRLLADEPDPLAVLLPSELAPESALLFFQAFDDLGWLRLTTLRSVAGTRATPVAADDLLVPARVADQVVPSANLLAAETLIELGGTMQRVLTRNDRIAAVVTGEALTTTSYAAATRPEAARRAAVTAQGWLRERLGQVRIEAPSSVTLSNERGGFSVTLVNELGEPVTLGLRVVTNGSALRVEAPEVIRLGPEERASVELDAATTELGVHNVGLVVTDRTGTPIGARASVPVRALQVGDVIWVILGLGLVLLVGTIGYRLAARIRAAHRVRRAGTARL